MADIRDISPEEAWEKHRQGALLLDVRSAEEFQEERVAGSVNIPHDKLASRLSELEEYRGREIVLFCASGRRSDYAKSVLEGQGFQNLHNAGGIESLKKSAPDNIEFEQG